MTRPSLSVILPNYNHSKYLPTCLTALATQSQVTDEILVIDDASTDNSVEVIQKFAKLYPIIKLIQNESNHGVSYTLNRGVDLARCDYLYFPGADDEILPGFIEKSMQLLGQHPEAGICCTIGDWRETATGLNWHMGVGMTDRPAFLPPREIVNLEKRSRFFIPNHTAIMKRSSLVKAGKFIPELKSSSDWFANSVVAFRDGLCVVPEPLAVFNIYPNSYFHRTRDDLKSYTAILEKILELLFSSDYKDVRELMIEAGSLHIFGLAMVRLISKRKEYRSALNARLLFKAFWHSLKLKVKSVIPAPIGNLYFRVAGYKARSDISTEQKVIQTR